MRDQDVTALADKVRQGIGLKSAVKAAGMHVKNTMVNLRDTRRDEFKAAKEEARSRR